MTERWRQYIQGGVESGGGPVPFALAQWGALTPVFETIRRALPEGGRVLDVGCGAGLFTSLLAHHGYAAVGIDQDDAIVALARAHAEYLRSTATFMQGDARRLEAHHGRFDLVYSLGVVEHFDRDVTVSLIAEQARCASRVLVIVPTRYTRYAGPITDERLYTLGALRRLVSDAGLGVADAFVYGAVPSRLYGSLERGLPGAVHRRLVRALSYGMGIGCLGVRK